VTEVVHAIIACVWLAWMPSTGPVDRYEVAVDGVVESVVFEPVDVVCFDVDRQAHDIVITARDIDGNSSPPSPALLLERIFNCDALGTGVVTVPDILELAPLVSVDFTVFDLLACIEEIGTCNNGARLVSCPEAAA